MSVNANVESIRRRRVVKSNEEEEDGSEMPLLERVTRGKPNPTERIEDKKEGGEG